MNENKYMNYEEYIEFMAEQASSVPSHLAETFKNFMMENEQHKVQYNKMMEKEPKTREELKIMLEMFNNLDLTGFAPNPSTVADPLTMDDYAEIIIDEVYNTQNLLSQDEKDKLKQTIMEDETYINGFKKFKAESNSNLTADVVRDVIKQLVKNGVFGTPQSEPKFNITYDEILDIVKDDLAEYMNSPDNSIACDNINDYIERLRHDEKGELLFNTLLTHHSHMTKDEFVNTLKTELQGVIKSQIIQNTAHLN